MGKWFKPSDFHSEDRGFESLRRYQDWNGMIYVMGQPAKITTERVCVRSGDDHTKLKLAARADRQRLKFDVDESFVLCLRCGQAIPLRS